MEHKFSARRQWVKAASMSLILGSGSLATAQSAEPKAEPSDAELEEVIVYGIRASLESALEAKRARSNLTEIINADDIGKLPDENLAEVLENIPGVQITRSAGIGDSVSIRGSDQNRIEINGRTSTPSGDARGGISFSDLPAELVRQLVVVKVPTADMVEGSLGGTINVNMYRGLKLKKPLRMIKLTSEYADNADQWNQDITATIGDNMSTEYGDFGAIVTLTHRDKIVREDALRSSQGVTQGHNGNGASQIDFNGDGLGDAYYKPGYSSLQVDRSRRKNTAFQGSLEWRPKEALKLFAEGTYTDFAQQNLGKVAAFGAAESDLELDGAADGTFGLADVAGFTVPVMTSGIIGGGIRNGQVDLPSQTASPDDGMRLRTNNKTGNRDTQSYVAALGGEWERNNVRVDFEVSSSGSKNAQNNLNAVWQFNDINEDGATVHGAEYTRIPIQYDIRGGFFSYGPVQGRDPDLLKNLADPRYYSLFIARDTDQYFDNDSTEGKVDITWNLDDELPVWWTSIKTGVRVSQRSIKRNRESRFTGNYPGVSGEDLKEYGDLGPGDFFAFNEGGSYLDNWFSLDPLAIAGNRAEVREALTLCEDNTDACNSNTDDPTQTFTVEEDTAALYFRADFETLFFGLPLSGNLGIRGVETVQHTFGSIIGEVDGLEVQQPIDIRETYTEWLPSASLVFLPAEDFQIRLGFAQILRRPDFSQLSPTVRLPLNENPVTVGNPELKPTTADQYDLTAEYYFRKGSVFSLGYYYKDLDGVVANQTSFARDYCNSQAGNTNAGDEELSQDFGCTTAWGAPGILVGRITPVNLPGGNIEGLEFSFQHSFRGLPSPYNGLGVVASYAYQKGSRDYLFKTPNFLREDGEFQEFPVNFRKLSENSYNFTVFYEKYGFNARLRYTFRDHFLVNEAIDVANGQPLYQDDRGQLNASMSYRINKMFTVRFNGVNLTKSRKVQPAVFASGPIGRMFDTDRRLALGITARF